ncbi:MAG: phosphoenolpyruvate--protein phosphotransferase [Candidatus Actinomarina sp.]|nr:phosphoenolpyruvate--protein phosphotransferase [Candidatus Actinomarina sp.]MBL6763008.1 phosphoenolpyruvate--protein phosphotransferase [Candidatus Actinomarina sp.]
MTNVKGLGASLGVAIGSSFVYENEIDFDKEATLSHSEASKKLIDKFNSQINEFRSKDRNDEADILDAYILILQDPEILKELNKNLKLEISEVFDVFTSTAKTFESMEDEYFKQRAEDIVSVGKHLVFSMQNINREVAFSDNTILIAEDLTPADTSSMDLSKVNGIILKEGGLTSHAVIVAKNLGIPCVIGIKEQLDNITNGKSMSIDGSTGEIVVSPSEKQISTLEQKQNKIEEIIKNFTEKKYKNLGVEFRVNIGSLEEINAFNHPFLNSIGLFRSEFIYLDNSTNPTLEQQSSVLKQITQKFNGTIVYRTLDIGGDKQVGYLNLPKEENPFLGVRGIRLSLRNLDLFESQVKSILTSESLERIKIMFPMISTVEDFKEAKAFVTKIAKELNVETPPIGIMVETPASAFIADKFSEIVDFISIGTNDLTQYIMAADRGNSNLGHYQEPLHPAVLRAISNVIDCSYKNNIEVSVCGEMSSDPVAAFALFVLGLKTFSMAPSAAPFVFDVLNTNSNINKTIVKKTILSQNNADEIRSTIQEIII